MQTLVMTVALGLLATTLLKWSFGRYMVISKVRRSIDSRTYIESCMAVMQTRWGTTNLPSTGDSCVFYNVPVTGQNITVGVTIGSYTQGASGNTGGQLPVTYTVSTNGGNNCCCCSL